MTTERRHPNVINQDEVSARTTEKGQHKYTTRTFGPLAGNERLGCTLTEVPAGSISYPFHYHCGNEEALYILSGRGTCRIGDARVAIRAGDWVAFPLGPAYAHQIINDGDAPLVYLALSTKSTCDVVGYPDSKKAAMAGGTSFQNPWIRQIARVGESLDYWDGEPNA
jgi:uncharacterized cupin superfamily protein